MKALLHSLWTDEVGATLVEYVLILALVVLGSAGAMKALEGSTSAHFDLKAGQNGQVSPLNPAGK